MWYKINTLRVTKQHWWVFDLYPNTIRNWISAPLFADVIIDCVWKWIRLKKTLRRYLVSVVSADVAQRGRRWLAEGGVDHVGGLKPRCITSQDREHRGRPGRSWRGWREVGQPLRQRIHVHLDFRIIKVLLTITVVWISISSETTSMNIIKIEFLFFLKRNEICTLRKKTAFVASTLTDTSATRGQQCQHHNRTLNLHGKVR